MLSSLSCSLSAVVCSGSSSDRRRKEKSREEQRRETKRREKRSKKRKTGEERRGKGEKRSEATRKKKKEGKSREEREDRFCPACVFCCCLSRLMFVRVLPWLSFVILSFLRFVLSLSVAGLGFVLVFLLSSCFWSFWVPFGVSFGSFSVVLGLLDGLEGGLDNLKNG